MRKDGKKTGKGWKAAAMKNLAVRDPKAVKGGKAILTSRKAGGTQEGY
jgi:hypothetical protein